MNRSDRDVMEKRHVTIRAALIALAMLAACASSKGTYHDSNMDFGSIRTVAVMPFQNLSREQAAADRVRDVFITALLASGAVYVLPQGEVAQAISKTGVAAPTTPSSEEVQKLAKALNADAVITGVVKEYGEVRSGSASGNICSISAQLAEAASGRVVWSASTTKGGIGFGARLVGGGGAPLNDVTEAAVNDLLDKLFK